MGSDGDTHRYPFMYREFVHIRWRKLIIQSVIASVIAWMLTNVPAAQVAPRTWFAFVQVPLIVFILICYIGKLFIDTLIYNRYQP
jgi:hypothetical protein